MHVHIQQACAGTAHVRKRHTTIYVSSYYFCVSPYYYICVLILYIYINSSSRQTPEEHMSVNARLLHMCPHTICIHIYIQQAGAGRAHVRESKNVVCASWHGLPVETPEATRNRAISRRRARGPHGSVAGAQFTCFTRTK